MVVSETYTTVKSFKMFLEKYSFPRQEQISIHNTKVQDYLQVTIQTVKFLVTIYSVGAPYCASFQEPMRSRLHCCMLQLGLVKLSLLLRKRAGLPRINKRCFCATLLSKTFTFLVLIVNKNTFLLHSKMHNKMRYPQQFSNELVTGHKTMSDKLQF